MPVSPLPSSRPTGRRHRCSRHWPPPPAAAGVPASGRSSCLPGARPTAHRLTDEEIFVRARGGGASRARRGRVRRRPRATPSSYLRGVRSGSATTATVPARLLCCFPVGGQAQLPVASRSPRPGRCEPRQPAPLRPVPRRSPERPAGAAARDGLPLLVVLLHEELAARGWRDVRPQYGYVLLACRDRPTTSARSAGMLGVSKQAASKLIDAMVEAGLLRRRSSAADSRAKPLSLRRVADGCWCRSRRSTSSWSRTGPMSSAADGSSWSAAGWSRCSPPRTAVSCRRSAGLTAGAGGRRRRGRPRRRGGRPARRRRWPAGRGGGARGRRDRRR